MWDSFLISVSKHPFGTVFFSITCSSLVGYMFANKQFRKFFFLAGLLSSLISTTFLHLKWDSFSIHLFSNEVESLKDTKILFLGDSITCEGTRPRGFITKLESVLSIDAQVVCQKGATAREILYLFNSESINPIPETVVVQAGINDLLGGSTTAQTIDAQEKLLSAIYKRFPDSRVFFLYSILGPRWSSWTPNDFPGLGISPLFYSAKFLDDFTLAILIGVFLFSASHWFSLDAKPLGWMSSLVRNFSKCSFSLYAIHFPLMAFGGALLASGHLQGFSHFQGILLVFGSCCLFALLFEFPLKQYRKLAIKVIPFLTYKCGIRS